MRISDWSSDVCSSDLDRTGEAEAVEHGRVQFVDDLAQVAVGGGHQAADRAQAFEHGRVGGGELDDAQAGGDRGHVLADLVVQLRTDAPAFVFLQRGHAVGGAGKLGARSEEHTSELQSLMRNSYAV